MRVEANPNVRGYVLKQIQIFAVTHAQKGMQKKMFAFAPWLGGKELRMTITPTGRRNSVARINQNRPPQRAWICIYIYIYIELITENVHEPLTWYARYAMLCMKRDMQANVDMFYVCNALFMKWIGSAAKGVANDRAPQLRRDMQMLLQATGAPP